MNLAVLIPSCCAKTHLYHVRFGTSSNLPPHWHMSGEERRTAVVWEDVNQDTFSRFKNLV